MPGRDRRFRQSHPIVSCSPCHVHHKSVGGRLLKTRPWPATRKALQSGPPRRAPHQLVEQAGERLGSLSIDNILLSERLSKYWKNVCHPTDNPYCDFYESCERRGHYTGFRTADESRAIRDGTFVGIDLRNVV